MKSKRYRAIFRALGYHRGEEGLYFKKDQEGSGYFIKHIALEKLRDEGLLKGSLMEDIDRVK
ncbi:hypothetical protein Goe27_01150 [Bacillus phage vB_BsuM-Goe27]|uniref:Uncharacterized protein n=1 Tax=Bacillus phage vB_BsuM-Goe3 TaxID=1933063 RepID=A0A1Z1DF29_BPGO3|nr:hypothetical protein HWB07_gp194 [Bacillus phage vB_BsuM-Goe3]AYJ75979.1 hypothetical protein BSP14_104 [Bacillus phage BSP14]AYJ76299.1 hypothetical protein BSP12_113 [Bacillus phage BSP12]QDP43139.1 hypothetical protein Goe7_c01140 [Bacillus phage vB_BveM-Goe7]UJJ74661.1 hypothetical protein [Bacillus phage BM-P1]WCS68978.1 hypothetical protein Goe17_01190 [Bacillus phage vB_BsuM-Goe17]WCS69231.1 hypothetical protein Goe20_01140 [Bacillus phage vB_BsuM-Goe20]WCS69489.1 hypothetical prot